PSRAGARRRDPVSARAPGRDRADRGRPDARPPRRVSGGLPPRDPGRAVGRPAGGGPAAAGRTGAVMTTSTDPGGTTAPGRRSPVVDAHHHLWDPARADYPWLTDELAPIRRRFGPEDLLPLLDAAGVDATVLVQTRSSVDETLEFLATAASTPR